jgi:hypothetical protein
MQYNLLPLKVDRAGLSKTWYWSTRSTLLEAGWATKLVCLLWRREKSPWSFHLWPGHYTDSAAPAYVKSIWVVSRTSCLPFELVAVSTKHLTSKSATVCINENIFSCSLQ